MSWPCFTSLAPPRTLHVSVSASLLPARDRVIDFGKHRGRMLGTLPSRYLTWVSKNLRAREFEGWARAADEVLRDPVYRDRIEWELAQRVLSGEGIGSGSRASAVSELLEISDRFGWDNEDKQGWKRVDFELLGTSKGGRIPRRKGGADDGVLEEKCAYGRGSKYERRLELFPKDRKVGFLGKGHRVSTEEELVVDKREERRERQMIKREQQMRKLKTGVGMVEGGGGSGANGRRMKKQEFSSPFPGRDALLDRIRRKQ